MAVCEEEMVRVSVTAPQTRATNTCSLFTGIVYQHLRMFAKIGFMSTEVPPRYESGLHEETVSP